MEDVGARFIFTGEVLGQRPKSQHRQAMDIIEKQAGLKGLLLRPLSAHLLPPTIPEKKGWVDREKLLAFQGRSRKGQMEYADKHGIDDFPQPAGGCCALTDENFVRRFRDKLDHTASPGDLSMDEIILLKVGRQLRLGDSLKIVVGRDEAENKFLERFTSRYINMDVVGFGSPLTLVEGEPAEEQLRLAAAITARYSGGIKEPSVGVAVRRNGSEEILTVTPASPEETERYLI